jgi:hypothetical protein
MKVYCGTELASQHKILKFYGNITLKNGAFKATLSVKQKHIYVNSIPYFAIAFISITNGLWGLSFGFCMEINYKLVHKLFNCLLAIFYFMNQAYKMATVPSSDGNIT